MREIILLKQPMVQRFKSMNFTSFGSKGRSELMDDANLGRPCFSHKKSMRWTYNMSNNGVARFLPFSWSHKRIIRKSIQAKKFLYSFLDMGLCGEGPCFEKSCVCS